MKLNRQQRRAGARKASNKGRWILLTPFAQVDHTLPDGKVVKTPRKDGGRQYVMKGVKDLVVFSVSKFMSQQQATEIEKQLSFQLKKDVIVVTDNIVMLHQRELSSAEVAEMLPKGVPLTGKVEVAPVQGPTP